MNRRHTASEYILRIMLNLIAIAISITCIFPLVWLLYSSLKTKGEFIADTLSLPTQLQFGNFVKAFELGNLVTSSLNSTFYVVINVVLVTIAALISAYFFARYEFPGKKFIYFIYLLGFLVPIYGMLVPVFLQFRLLGLLNKRVVLLFPYYAMQVSLAIFLLESFIKGIPKEIDEAASIDGCSVGRTLFSFILPLSGPAVATVVILTSLATWNEFGFSAVLIRDIDLRTVSVAVRAFSAGLDLEYTFMMAALVSVSLPIVLLYLVFSKYIMGGIATSGVKG